jgi:hypothetical protein
LLPWVNEGFGYSRLLEAAAIILLVSLVTELFRQRGRFVTRFALPAVGVLACVWYVLPDEMRTLLGFAGVFALLYANWLIVQQLGEGEPASASEADRAASQTMVVRPSGRLLALVSVLLGGPSALLMIFAYSGMLSELAILVASVLLGLAAASWLPSARTYTALPLAAVFWPALAISA